MTQLFAQQDRQPDVWVMSGAPTATTVFLSLQTTINYSSGSPDTLPANTPAVIYGTSDTAFDRSLDVWVPLTVRGSRVLSIIKESQLATIAADYVAMARVELHGIKPYQPEPYLAAGGLGSATGTPSTLTQVSTPGQDTVYAVGTAGSTPLTSEPSGWTTSAFDDTAWTASVDGFVSGYSGVDPLGSQGAHWVGVAGWATVDQPAPGGQQWLLRHHFSLPLGPVTSASVQVSPDDVVLGAYVNGTLVGGPSPGAFPGAGSGYGSIFTYAIAPSLLTPGGANVLALEIINNANSGGGGPTRVQFVLGVNSGGAAAVAGETIEQAGTVIGTRPVLNFTAGATVTDDSVNNRVDVAITGSGGTVTSVSVRAYNSGNVTVGTSGAWTSLPLDSTRWDQGTSPAQHSNSTNNSRLVCQQAGVYDIGGAAYFSFSPAAAALVGIRVLLNGTTAVADHSQVVSTAVGDYLLAINTHYKLAVNDYVEIQVLQSTGSSKTVTAAGNTSPEGWMTLIA